MPKISDMPVGAGRKPFETVAHMFWDAVDTAPESPAIACGDVELTYGAYGRATAGLARSLAEFAGAGQRIAVVMPNSIELGVATFAGLSSGSQLALCNPGYTFHELLPLLSDADPSVVIVAAGGGSAAEQVAAHLDIPVIGLGPDGRSLEELASAGASPPAELPTADELATLMYTGGTTGISKGVDHSHANVMATVQAMEAVWSTEMGMERWIGVAPGFHIWGLLMGCLNPVYGHARMRVLPSFNPAAMVQLLAEERITVFGGGPAAIYGGLLAQPAVSELDLSALRVCPGGGSAFPLPLLEQWDAVIGTPIYEALGMTEVAPITAQPTGSKRCAGTVGQAAPLVEIEVVALGDPNEVLDCGDVGEIMVRAPHVMLGYRNRPDETADSFADGWFLTGDIGRFDADGYLSVVDRKKDMIIVGGFNVYPREVDEVLLSAPSVAEAATIGVADDRRGERPVSYVVLRSGARSRPQELLAHCSERLADYKQPAEIVIVDAIPKTPANKIDRKALREAHS